MKQKRYTTEEKIRILREADGGKAIAVFDSPASADRMGRAGLREDLGADEAAASLRVLAGAFLRGSASDLDQLRDMRQAEVLGAHWQQSNLAMVNSAGLQFDA
jgi:hypothetical protein